jgi:hypothetical protein
LSFCPGGNTPNMMSERMRRYADSPTVSVDGVVGGNGRLLGAAVIIACAMPAFNARGSTAYCLAAAATASTASA